MTYNKWKGNAKSRLPFDNQGKKREIAEPSPDKNDDDDAEKRGADGAHYKIIKQIEDKKRQNMIDRKAMKKLQEDMFGQRKEFSNSPKHLQNALKIANAEQERRAEHNDAMNDAANGV